MNNKIIVGITGGSGAIYGIRMLEALKELGAETHLIISEWGEKTIQMETSYSLQQVKEMADVYHSIKNQAASISSGSFRVDGMIIAPCSMKTLAGIASGLASDLISRSADVMLKERKKLILLTRESPLNLIHIRNMETAILAGAMIFPPMPAFYNKPQTLDDIVNHTVGRVLDQFGYDPEWVKRWGK
ncbi:MULTISPECIES: UbiX family flavin prenyltransferase [unclassified Paenibacillus]|uniref:UbiX family flavin prenyltransferase n=1 Tax=unclassified Paenibacillus TaxID=185978 RepID=UPI001AE267E2|nr:MULTISPECIES: UbiX family flavin prenyltransferase [unclassified Paenibacillus]MBP1157251.1 4-hydroxy-3-polyprenylbenzoate decarboxylase [Paenibacillus sp. PvP091]MBP1172010.1 4-hydroxy-3-polyprenylbenzoate decarboxylase [Paenibacillus sp. PvR098]MBP2438391.1 4-hydroxy-3-polyprenylbenzoate decarboxylase [Paenibacillus sp. PvP052]